MGGDHAAAELKQSPAIEIEPRPRRPVRHTTFGNLFVKEVLPRLRERNPEPTKVALAAE